MKVLVTGHKGYIGTVLVPMLLAKGHEVVGLDSDFYEKCTFGQPFVTIPEMQKDIRDVELQDLEGFTAVLHLAGLSNDPLGNLNPVLLPHSYYTKKQKRIELHRPLLPAQLASRKLDN
jgi:nucleoside-diphosphate-sugar epimerase